MAKRVTLRDLAEHLGINPSSVSRALNPETHHMVTPELVKRVRAAAKKLGYNPNPAAYALRKGRSHIIGIIIPDLMNPVFPPIIRGAQNVFDRANYTTIIAYSENDIERALTEIRKMDSRHVDGFLMACAFRRDASVDYCIHHKKSLVLVNRTIDDAQVDEVLVDDAAGVRLAVRHLVELGHRRIAHLAGPQSISNACIRYRGFQKALREQQLEPDPGLIVFADAFTETEGRKAATELLSRRAEFTAIIAANDLMALGCIEALHQAGRVCPGEVSVIGFNNMPFLDWFKTPLTTVAIPHFQLGEQAARMLLEHIQDPRTPARRLLLKPMLMVRASTRAPRAARRARAQ